MAILIYNDGDKLVDTIPDRNMLTKRFDGMRVRVKDATGDIQVGGGSAEYLWDTSVVGGRWAITWADTYPTMSFANETLPITGSTITLGNVPANGVLFSAVIIDDNGVIMGDADIASVNLGVVTLSSSNYSGKQLKVNYAYGSMASQIQVVYDQINERIDAVVGPAPEDMNTLKELADAVTNLSTTLESASTSSTEASNYVNTVLV
jgi:hypothetical protein